MQLKILFVLIAATLISFQKDEHTYLEEDASTFSEISSTTIGESGAAEITAYDPSTKKLFVVTNSGGITKIDVLNLADPSTPTIIGFIDISTYGGGVNSVTVHDGKLAAAVEGFIKTDPGKVVVFNTSDHGLIKQIPVGALPDMITFSNDGKFILTANEGEPNDTYTIDPTGTVSIISVKEDYVATTLDFSAFSSQADVLKSRGLRVFGPGASFAQDMEPEYLTISSDSKTAWVTLQENNAIAKIDIGSKTITELFPLGFKNYELEQNAFDPCDKDGGIFLNKWKVNGMYQPDAIAVMEDKGVPYLFTANEGDVREYAGFTENKRIKDLSLDALVFPDAATLKNDPKLGRLNVTTTPGGVDMKANPGVLYSFGARSFSVWNGLNGSLVFDSKNQLEHKCIEAGKYDDARSDDKGVEPEGITIGIVGKNPIAFVGMERSDAIALYNIRNPRQPEFISLLPTGDAPEGITFIPANQSPIGKSLIVVSSENDGTIKIYKTN